MTGVNAMPSELSTTETCVKHTTSVVYLVDDDPGISAALSMLLRHRGFRVRAFQSAKEFLAGYQSTENAYIVIDVRLPDMTGLEALDELALAGHEPPAVVITGHGPPPVRFQSRVKNVTSVLLKPFDPDELLALIKQGCATKL